MPVKLYIDLIADLFVFRILSYEEQQYGGRKNIEYEQKEQSR